MPENNQSDINNEKLCGIYCITNMIDGKKYVGQTMEGFKKRWRRHINELNNNKHKNNHLQGAWNKCKEEKFSFDILEVCSSMSECNIAEKYWIAHLNTINRKRGYNLMTGGDSSSPSKETRIKLSNALKGRMFSAETKEKITKSKTGHSVSTETRRKLSIANTGIFGSMFGKNHSEESKKKSHESNTGKKHANNTSGYIGVYLDKRTDRWRAIVNFNRKNKSCGFFADKLEAAKAYDLESYKIYGRLDMLNFPEEYLGITQDELNRDVYLKMNL